MPRKTDKINIRIAPSFKEALQKVAEREHRSVANMIEVPIWDCCLQAGIHVEGSKTERKIQAGKHG